MGRVAALLFLTIALAACAEAPKVYSFDQEKFRADLEDADFVKKLSCGVMSMLFYAEPQEALKSGQEPSLEERDTWTPATINLRENTIEWVELGQSSEINDGLTSIAGADASTMQIAVNVQENTLSLEVENEGVTCSFPFASSS